MLFTVCRYEMMINDFITHFFLEILCLYKYCSIGGGFKMTENYDSMEALDASLPDKHAVAEELGIPLDKGDNSKLTTEEVGKIGGRIGGQKVKKMIQAAEAAMAKKDDSF